MGGVTPERDLTLSLPAVAVLPQPLALLLGTHPALLTVPTHVRDGEGDEVPPADPGPGGAHHHPTPLVTQDGGGGLPPPPGQGVDVRVTDGGSLQSDDHLALR